LTPAPRFSILTPVYRPPPKTLKAMLASVQAQTLADWEHILVDDHSGDRSIESILDDATGADSRVRVHKRKDQGGIVAATNDALVHARGEFVAFLDHDDEIAPEALERMAAAIAEHPDVDYLYSDQDKIDEWGMHFDPFVKPGWSPDRLCSQMYVTHFRVVRRSIAEEIGGLRPGFEGSQDWDLALRVVERSQRVQHVPGLYYHWRMLPGSASGDIEAKPWAYEASHRAVVDHVERVGIQATVEAIDEYPGHFWMRPRLNDRPPVSVVIPTAGQSREEAGVSGPLVINCIRSILERSTYENLELVVVMDANAPGHVRAELEEVAGDRLRLVDYEGPFNFSAKVNLGVRESSGEQILLLNDDVEVLPRGWRPPEDEMLGILPDWEGMETDGGRIWIESMLVYSMLPGMGAVGTKLYLPDGRLQHGGVICRRGLAGHPYYRWPGGTPGYGGNLLVASNFLAVTAACLMTPRSAFEAVGGFDEELPLNYNDVDFCLKLREHGLRSVLLPHVEMLHYESLSRGDEPPATAEIEALQARWNGILYDDPFYGHAFVSDDFELPVLGRRGGWQEKADLLSYWDKVRRNFRAGGFRQVAERSYRRLRYFVRRVIHRLRRSVRRQVDE
jgi:glycosyltransferase involved in cell wall biosynthesis